MAVLSCSLGEEPELLETRRLQNRGCRPTGLSTIGVIAPESLGDPDQQSPSLAGLSARVISQLSARLSVESGAGLA